MKFPGPEKIVEYQRNRLLCLGDQYRNNIEDFMVGARFGFDAEEAINKVKNSTLFRDSFIDDSEKEEIEVNYDGSSMESE